MSTEVRYDNSLGSLGAPLGSTDTTITFTGSPGWATLSGDEYIKLVLDPPISTSPVPNPVFEIVYVTAYTGGASTGTIVRGQEGTIPQAHVVNATWLCSPTAADYDTAAGVTSVTAGDSSIVIGGTGADPTVETGTLDVIATDHPPAADWSNNAHKITDVADGTVATDAAAFGQIPTSLPPSGSAGGVLSGSYPNPGLSSSAEAIPNGWTATTQAPGDNSTKVATTAYADAAAGSALEVTDGTTSVSDVTQITVDGGTVSGTSPDATITVTGTALELTDGTHTVSDVAQITVSGGTVSGTTPDATITVAAGSIEVTDGTHTVTGATEIDFTSGATVTASGSTAQVAVTGGTGSGVGFGSVVAKTVNYTVVSGDSGTVFTFDGSSLTATLPAAAPAEPWSVTILNLNASALTVSPNGLQLNGSASSVTLAQNQATTVWSDGTNYECGHAIGSGGSSVTVQGAIGTNLGATATVNFGSTEQEIWLVGTLNADLAITQENWVAGCLLLVGVLQDGTGSHTVTIDGTLADVNPDAGELSGILVANPDVSNSLAFPLTVPGPAGLGFGSVVAKSANYTLLSTDNGNIFPFNGSSLTATLPSTAPAEPWMVTVINENASALTVSPNGLDLNGSSGSITLGQNQGAEIWSDGSNYFYFVGPQGPQGSPGASGGTDALQNGILVATSVAVSAVSVNTSTGALTFTLASGTIYVMSSGGVLTAVSFAGGTYTKTIGAITSGDYAVVGIELDTSGNVTVNTGTSTATQLNTASLIAAHTPATSSGNIRVWDFSEWNNAGSYEFGDKTTVATQGVNYVDRRPWARGALWSTTRNSNASAGNDYTTSSTTFVPIDSTNLAVRLECTGKPVRVTLIGVSQNGGSTNQTIFGLGVDGVLANGVDNSGGALFQMGGSYINPGPLAVVTPAAGSHLFAPYFRVSTNTATLFARADIPLTLMVEELVRQNSSNGTV